MASVDVIVPCYNYARFLRECVESVLDQGGVDVRVLIIDDASPDNTPEVGQALAASDPRVEYRRHAVNCGHIATYNEGLDWARADYALLLSADDVLTPGAFGRAAKLLDAHPEVGFVFGRGVTTEHPDYRNHPRPPEYRQKVLTGADFWELCCTNACYVVSTPTAVVRTSLQKKLGGYRPELPHTGDLEMWLRFAAHGSVGVIDADQAFYRIHRRNMSACVFPDRLKVLQQHRTAFEVLFREYGTRLEDGARLRRLAMRSLALAAVRNATRLFEQGDARAACQLEESAKELFPPIQFEREWARLRWKRRLGRRLSGALCALLRAVRKVAPADRSPIEFGGVFSKPGARESEIVRN